MSQTDLPGWVWPSWLEHQIDPQSPAHVADQPLPGAVNVTARSWTVLGNLDSSVSATVDSCGLVTPTPPALHVVHAGAPGMLRSTNNGRRPGWSLDWWIGADDRWHLPSREAAVRQRLVDGAPVVETAVRVPGGDAVHRAYAVRQGADEAVVVEVENRSPAPMALALVVRPYDGLSLTRVQRIELVDDTRVVVDGRVALLLPRRPNRMAASTAAAGDVAGIVLGAAAGEAFEPVDDPAGLATAAFIWPLPHRTTMRVSMPLGLAPNRPRRRFGRPGMAASSSPPVPSGMVATVPTAAQVANGWRVHGARGLRLVLPDDRLTAAVEANRGHLLVGSGGLVGSGRSSEGDTLVLEALDRFGFAAEVGATLRELPERLRQHGALAEEHDADARSLHTLGTHWRLHRDRALVLELAPTVASVAESIGRAMGRGRGVVAATSAWSVAGLEAAAELLAVAGEDRAAADATRHAKSARARLAPVADALASRGPLGLADPRGRRVDDALGRPSTPTDTAAVPTADGRGLDVGATIGAALVEVARGERRSLDRLRWLLDVASPTWTWPTVVHPRLGSGADGDGHDIAVTAGLLMLVRQLLVREVTGGGMAVLSLVPETWLGQGVEVHDAPTEHGLLSYAVRWHADRPALLWERTPHMDPREERSTEVTLTAPGLDPSWSSIERRGEALLAPVPVPVPATKVGLSRRR